MSIFTACNGLRQYCIDHEWARNAFAFVGAALFVTTIWVSIDYQLEILEWVRENILINLAILGLVSAVNLTCMFGSLCLGFSECSEEDKNCLHAYRGRGKGGPLFPDTAKFIDNMGKNTKRGSRRPISDHHLATGQDNGN